ncbi:MAG: leucine-rich repeat domain-containing protein, partial [Acutalibacteraceae bacterium]
MKKAIQVISSLILTFCAVTSGIIYTSAENIVYTDGNFDYRITENNKAEVWVNYYADFGGNDYNETVVVPSTIDGFEVAGFCGSDCFSSSDNSSYTGLILSEGIEYIADGACRLWHNLRTVSFPSTLKSIGKTSFCDAPITEVNIPESVEYMGDSAFYNCFPLKINLPGSLEYFGKNVFLVEDVGPFKDLDTEIYFNGTEERWNELTVEAGENYYTGGKVYCTGNQSFEAESIKPAEGGN